MKVIVLWKLEKPQCPGVFTGLVTPVPIPNTEVKQPRADDSSNDAAKVGPRQDIGAFYLFFCLCQKV